MTEQVDDFLAHYGVLGMKWGKRKAQETGPGLTRIERRDEKREAKAKKFDARVSQTNTTIKDLDREIKAIAKGDGSRYDRTLLESMKTDQIKERDRLVKDAKAIREGRMTSTQKKVVIGASVVAAVAVTYVVQDQIQSGNATRLIAKGKERMSGEAFTFKKNTSLSNPDFDVDDIHMNIVKHINPEYGKMGTKMNCRRATFSYEMRRRGYDVKATKTTNANGQNVMGLLNATSPGDKIRGTSMPSILNAMAKESPNKLTSKPTPVTDLMENFSAGGKNKIVGGGDRIFKILGEEPNGSRGELGVMWKMGGGHSMAYEIVKGKPVIFDGQTGKVFENAEKLLRDMPSIKDAGFTRLDNIELNHDYLMRWMTNA